MSRGAFITANTHLRIKKKRPNALMFANSSIPKRLPCIHTYWLDKERREKGEERGNKRGDLAAAKIAGNC
jgi:hypothetical protein